MKNCSTNLMANPLITQWWGISNSLSTYTTKDWSLVGAPLVRNFSACTRTKNIVQIWCKTIEGFPLSYSDFKKKKKKNHLHYFSSTTMDPAVCEEFEMRTCLNKYQYKICCSFQTTYTEGKKKRRVSWVCGW